MTTQLSSGLTSAAFSVLAGNRPDSDALRREYSESPTLETCLMFAFSNGSLNDSKEAFNKALTFDSSSEIALAGLKQIEEIHALAGSITEDAIDDNIGLKTATRIAEDAKIADKAKKKEEARLATELAAKQKAEEERLIEQMRLKEEARIAEVAEEARSASMRILQSGNSTTEQEPEKLDDEMVNHMATIRLPAEGGPATTRPQVSIETEITDQVNELCVEIEAAVATEDPLAIVDDVLGDVEAKESQRSGKPLVLIADDSSTIRQLLTMNLTNAGFEVMSAEDGVEALILLDERQPDLILSDTMMPRLDGYKLCKFVKKHKQTQQIPVLMLSGKDGVFDRLRGRMSGCDGYITKPFDSGELIEKVKEFVSVEV